LKQSSTKITNGVSVILNRFTQPENYCPRPLLSRS